MASRVFYEYLYSGLCQVVCWVIPGRALGLGSELGVGGWGQAVELCAITFATDVSLSNVLFHMLAESKAIQPQSHPYQKIFDRDEQKCMTFQMRKSLQALYL